MELLQNEFVQFLILVLISVIAIIVAYIIYRKQQKHKKLSYYIISKTSLLNIKEEIEEDIEILYKGEPVKQVEHLLLRIICSGNIPILYEDYYTPITINLGKTTRILSAQVFNKIPDDQQVSVSVEDNKVVVQPHLLNQGDIVDIKILANNMDRKISINGRIAGVKKIIEENIIKSKAVNILFYIGIAFMSIYVGVDISIYLTVPPPQRIFLSLYFTFLIIIGMICFFFGYLLEREKRKNIKKYLKYNSL